MTRSEAILYIQERTLLRPVEKEALIRKFFTHSCYFQYILIWIKVINNFISEEFHEFPYTERLVMVQTLAKVIVDRKSSNLFQELTKVFFENPSCFLELILKRSRIETNYKIKALMTELLLGFCKDPLTGSNLEDYLPGLHHHEELVRLKALHFLFRNYRGRALLLILKEIPKIKPSPSPLLHRTLNHFLYLHPELDWTKAIKQMVGSLKIETQKGQESLWLLYEEAINSIERHQILSMNLSEENPRLDTSQSSKGIKAEVTLEEQRELTGFRLERFEKIGSTHEWR